MGSPIDIDECILLLERLSVGPQSKRKTLNPLLLVCTCFKPEVKIFA